MTEIMPHLLQREALQYKIIVHLHSILDTSVEGRPASPPYLLHVLNIPAYKPLPHTFERMAVYELYFPHKKMHIFESNNKNTIPTAKLNYGGPLGLWCIDFS